MVAFVKSNRMGWVDSNETTAGAGLMNSDLAPHSYRSGAGEAEQLIPPDLSSACIDVKGRLVELGDVLHCSSQLQVARVD